MAKGMLSETSQQQTRNKARKVLRTLQVSVDEQAIEKEMVKPNDKAVSDKEKPEIKDLKSTEKENFVSMRRSKRKNVASSTINYSELSVESKITKSTAKCVSKQKKTAKSKKGSSAAVKKNEKTKLNQTKINFSPCASSTVLNENPDEFETDNPEKRMLVTSAIEDSGFDASCGTSDQGPMNSTVILGCPNAKTSVKHCDETSILTSGPMNSTVILKSSNAKTSVKHDETSILTSDTPPLSYWRDLAEQRRIALEKALHENELLHDQLTVLEAENSQLKHLVREAENVVKIVQGIVQ